MSNKKELPEVELKENGLFVDGKKINAITDLNISSSIDGYSEVTVSFLCHIKGFDDKPRYMFEDK